MWERLLIVAAVLRSYVGLKYYLFGWRVRALSRRNDYDFCHAMDVMSLGAVGGFAARGIPILLDANEIPDLFERQGRHFVRTSGRVKKHLMGAIARAITRVNAITAASHTMADFIERRFGKPATAIPNARAPIESPIDSPIREDCQCSPKDQVIVYPCTAAPHLGVETAIRMLRHLPDTFRLAFVGRFATAAYHREIAQVIVQEGVGNRVTLKGELPEKEYLNYISGADIGLIPLRFDYQNQKVVLPWRFLDLAAARVPIVATANDEIVRLRERYDFGEIARTTDERELAAAVGRLANSSAERIVRIRDALLVLLSQFHPNIRDARYKGAIRALTPNRVSRAAFICNIALRSNRRITGFINLVCAMGWQVDLYSVRPPEAHLFSHPDQVRHFVVLDRVKFPRVRFPKFWARYLLSARQRATRPFIGLWFGARQLRRSLQFAARVRDLSDPVAQWDLIVACDIFAMPAGLRLATSDSRLVYDATETPELRDRTSPLLRSIPRILRVPFRCWEKAYTVRPGLIVAASHGLARFLRRRHGHRPNILAVRNASIWSRDEIRVRTPSSSLRHRLGIGPNECILVSPCGISTESGADIAIQALRYLPDCVLVFIGRFATRAAEREIRRQVRAQRAEHRCFFLDELEHQLYLLYLTECDLGLVLFDTTIPNLRLSAPNRFFDLLAMEVPMIATAVGDIEAILRRTHLGSIVRNPRPLTVAQAILDLRKRLGIASGGQINADAQRRLHQVARFFSWAKEARKLVSDLTTRFGPIEGKRVLMLTLRNGFSNQRFFRMARAFEAAGATIAAFDTSVGQGTLDLERPSWLTTIPLR